MSKLGVIHSWLLAGLAGALLVALPPANAQNAAKVQDPGVRGGPAGAGGPLPELNAAEQTFFANAKDVFQEIDSVSGKIKGEEGKGLGPRFNMNSCGGCHSQPDVGGTSPSTNPQVAVAKLHGANNVVPSFISKNGPVREARYVNNPDGSPDGGVHALFVISGRTDAPGCNIVQPNFAAALNANNVIFRIPTPVFGAGLVEAIPDDGLRNVLAQSAPLKSQAGISGAYNYSGNDGTIARFGWKAQNKSMLMFAGEAYNVEQGVTNELFPNERETDRNCQFNGTPEDRTGLDLGNPNATPTPSDIVSFAAFARLSNAPTPAPSALPNTQHGSDVFNNIGCALCHTVNQTTGNSPFTGQSNKTFQPYSDFALHAMGDGLADNISQGGAAGNEFRSAPLWGVGQRIFFLHDGRTSDLVEAIEQHASRGSEANAVINNFNMLGPSDQQALLNFLRSL
jgi:CxxC motif-containing protein (DUF1111 family)